MIIQSNTVLFIPITITISIPILISISITIPISRSSQPRLNHQKSHDKNHALLVSHLSNKIQRIM